MKKKTDFFLRCRLALILLEGFAGLALLLDSVGICGVISYGVTQHQREIGLPPGYGDVKWLAQLRPELGVDSRSAGRYLRITGSLRAKS